MFDEQLPNKNFLQERKRYIENPVKNESVELLGQVAKDPALSI